MNWLKKNRWKLLTAAAVVAVLAFAFWYGGGAPGMQGWTVDKKPAPEQEVSQKTEDTSEQAPVLKEETLPSEEETPASPEDEEQPEEEQKPAEETKPAEGLSASEKVDAAAAIAGGSQTEQGSQEYSESQGMVIDPSTGKDRYMTDPVPEGKPLPVEPQDVVLTDKAHTCTIAISCATILEHMSWLDPEKTELVPADGWILPPTEVTFYEGESVFNVLQRTCKQKSIHMEFENTPIYNSAYIEGIGNLYEFDCGELSGWMYQVNGWFPNYGCSRYALQAGDVIQWEYTCDLGVDIGGFYSTGG